MIFDQWNDIIFDGSSHALNLAGGQTQNLMFPSFTWHAHLWFRVYMDTQGLRTPVMDAAGNLDPIKSPELIQVPTRAC